MPTPPPLPRGAQMPPGLFVVEQRPGGAYDGADGGADTGTGAGADPSDAIAIVEATELTRGPWDHGVMHGGSVCGLVGWAIENALAAAISQRNDQRGIQNSDPTQMLCSRLTVDILTGVPVCRLAVATRIVKLGQQTATVDAEFWRADDQSKRPLARATSQWLVTNHESDSGDAQSGNGTQSSGGAAHEPASEIEIPAIPGEQTDPTGKREFDYPRPGFNVDAVEMRNVAGSSEEPGPGVSWVRLTHPLIAGETTSTFGYIATLSDMSAAVGWDNNPDGGSYVNTDITMQLMRLPVDEWVLVQARTETVGNGIACNWASVSDQAGLFGWVLASKLEVPFSFAGQAQAGS